MENKTKLFAEIAKTPEQHQRGLMGRKYLPFNSGMLFDFGKEKELSFWMSNTYIPLEIAFVDKVGKVGQIEKMYPLNTRAIKSNSKYRYALEVNDGWFAKNKIQVGAQLQMPTTEEDPLNNPATDQQPLPEPSAPTEQAPNEQGEQQEKQEVRPDIPILQSYKDILKSIQKDYKIKIVLEYITKDGVEIPPKAIETPFEFRDTAEGDADGLLTAWDSQKSHFSNFIIENILSIKDLTGKTINNVEQVEKIFKNTPLTTKDEQSIKGKMSNI